MEGRTVVLAAAVLGWLVAGLIGLVFIVWFGFAAVGLAGLMLWFVCVRMELEKDAVVGTGRTPELIGHQRRAREGLSFEQRASWRHEQSRAMQSARFFKNLGMALTLVGLAGFLYFQL